ncbi:hypothetical protein LINPERPRIM_LOCUS35388 [Linum perenne]
MKTASTEAAEAAPSTNPTSRSQIQPWSGVTCSTQGDFRVVTELEVYAVSIVGPFPTAVTNLLDRTRLGGGTVAGGGGLAGEFRREDGGGGPASEFRREDGGGGPATGGEKTASGGGITERRLRKSGEKTGGVPAAGGRVPAAGDGGPAARRRRL